jgi:hypothetical protein
MPRMLLTDTSSLAAVAVAVGVVALTAALVSTRWLRHGQSQAGGGGQGVGAGGAKEERQSGTRSCASLAGAVATDGCSTPSIRALEALVAFLRRLQQLEHHRDRYVLREHRFVQLAPARSHTCPHSTHKFSALRSMHVTKCQHECAPDRTVPIVDSLVVHCTLCICCPTLNRSARHNFTCFFAFSRKMKNAFCVEICSLHFIHCINMLNQHQSEIACVIACSRRKKLQRRSRTDVLCTSLPGMIWRGALKCVSALHGPTCVVFCLCVRAHRVMHAFRATHSALC